MRWRLVLAYDGTGFRGFADQPGVPTVAGALAAALARTVRTGHPPRLTCAGRTDAGVHARGQVVHVELPDPLPAVRDRAAPGGTRSMAPEDLVRSLNRQLAPAVVVRHAEPAPPGFDARRSAVARSYRYLVWNAPVADPLLAPVSWHVPGHLDLRAMAGAADSVVGRHDFRGFCRRPPGSTPEEPLQRRVLDASWSAVSGPEVDDAGEGSLLRFDIRAESFCHQMVRSLVGALVAVGSGHGDVAWMVALLRSADRKGAPRPAPPHGLCLVAVDFRP